jgi:hypothetical protein
MQKLTTTLTLIIIFSAFQLAKAQQLQNTDFHLGYDNAVKYTKSIEHLPDICIITLPSKPLLLKFKSITQFIVNATVANAKIILSVGLLGNVTLINNTKASDKVSSTASSLYHIRNCPVARKK